MKQLALGIALQPEFGLDDSEPGANGELHAALRQALAGGPERFVYAWGEDGSGRSHLLRACAVEARRCGRQALLAEAASVFSEPAPDDRVWLVDDVHRLDEAAQVALFHLHNRVRDGGRGLLVATGNAAPAALALRADLRTRLGSGLVYRLQPLGDEHKTALLVRHARSRGLVLPEAVAAWLVSRADRDLRALVAALDRLDRGSLEHQRPLTIPFLRQLLAEAPPAAGLRREPPPESSPSP